MGWLKTSKESYIHVHVHVRICIFGMCMCVIQFHVFSAEIHIVSKGGTFIVQLHTKHISCTIDSDDYLVCCTCTCMYPERTILCY